MLAIDNLTSRYGRIEVLHGVSCEVQQGEIVTLVGSNGAGKSTLLRAISGVQPVASGTIRLDGEAINSLSAHARVARGIAQVPEGRQVFSPLCVEDNLRLGAYRRHDTGIASDLDKVYATFPALADKRGIAAGSLSGGQQQMLAIGRALMSGLTVLLVEQNAYAALAIADRGYVMETGRITMSGSGASLLGDERVRLAYLGVEAPPA
jgi:branched-chain amino acid transport system ATP-binding protein